MGVIARRPSPVMEVLEQSQYGVLYIERNHGIKLVYRHYLSPCDYYADVVYIGDDGYLDAYHIHGRDVETYLGLFLNSETAEQIRKEVASVKTIDDFYGLLNRLLKTTFCIDGHDTYHICY
jgi:hypothetical protein